MRLPALLKLAATDPTPPPRWLLRFPWSPKELTMTLYPFRDETPHPVEPTLSQLEHQVGAAQASALVLTLEGLPDQAATYLARAALFEVQLGQLRPSPAPASATDSAR
jgi:hypothetical protein